MLKSLSSYKTILWDCNGVIVNSNQIKTKALHEAASGYGADHACELVEFHKLHGGVSRQIKFTHFFE